MATHFRRRTPLEVSLACAGLMVERGDARATVRELAAAGGVSERTFYRMFPAKEDSLRPLLEEGTVRLATELAACDAGEGVVEGAIAAFTRTMTGEFSRRTRPLMPIVYADQALRRVWQAASFDAAGRIHPEICRLSGRESGDTDSWIATGRVIVAVIAALDRVVQGHADPAETMRAVLALAEEPLDRHTQSRGSRSREPERKEADAEHS